MLQLMKFLSFLLSKLPMGFLLFAGTAAGRLTYRLDRRHRIAAIENLERAFGKEKTTSEIESIAKRVFENLSITFFEVMRIPWLKKKDLDGYVECRGLENLKKALARGRGVILFTAHFGNWELLAAFYALQGFPMDIVVRDLDNPFADRFVRWLRTSNGNRVVPKLRSMRRLLKGLEDNGVVGILLDQNVAANEGLFVDFFGTPACTNKGPALLASMSGASVIPTFIIRNKTVHTVVLGEEIELSSTGDKGKDALVNTARFTEAIEQAIRKNPEQWFWVHRRWKTRPPVRAFPDQ